MCVGTVACQEQSYVGALRGVQSLKDYCAVLEKHLI